MSVEKRMEQTKNGQSNDMHREHKGLVANLVMDCEKALSNKRTIATQREDDNHTGNETLYSHHCLLFSIALVHIQYRPTGSVTVWYIESQHGANNVSEADKVIDDGAWMGIDLSLIFESSLSAPVSVICLSYHVPFSCLHTAILPLSFLSVFVASLLLSLFPCPSFSHFVIKNREMKMSSYSMMYQSIFLLVFFPVEQYNGGVGDGGVGDGEIKSFLVHTNNSLLDFFC